MIVRQNHLVGAKYLWAIYESFDTAALSDFERKNHQAINQWPSAIDPEATASPKGDKIAFTSTRGGDLDLSIMDIDGKNQKQIVAWFRL
jgi:hypothetical protein